MKRTLRSFAIPIMGISVVMLAALVASLLLPLSGAGAAPAPQKGGIHKFQEHLRKGPVKPKTPKTSPLHLPGNLPKQPPSLPASPNNRTSFSLMVDDHSQQAAGPSACTTTTLDLKVLIIASDGNEADLPAIQQALDYLGTPYTVYVASRTPNGLTPDKLSSGCHGYYQGVILTNGYLSYYNGSAWVSALSQQEWTDLWTYEAAMGVREISWYTYPTADFGYQPPTAGYDTTTNPLSMALTSQGKTTFQYLNPGTSIAIQNAYTYVALPLTDGATTPLLTDASGNALGAIRTFSDGRQLLSLTFDSNPYLLHDMVLSYGLVNWVTKGLFLGERHIYASPQIDDVFIDGSEWLPTTPCGTPVDNTGATYRINGSDWLATLNWQSKKQASTLTKNLTLTMAFNGYGTTADAGYSPDTLTPLAKSTQSRFNWVSHTYDHTNLDAVDYATATSEITLNNQVAKNTLHLTHFNTANMVTPDVSGLANPNFLQAAHDNGLQYLVTDTSVAGYNNPSPNAGIYNSYQPSILMIPRRPTNLFYNVTTPADWVAEYNCLYASFWGRNLSYQEILDKESQNLLSYMLVGDIDPWMFHQENLRAYDGVHTLLGDLLDATLQKYAQYYTLPMLSPVMDNIGQRVAHRMQYNAAGVTASIVPGVSITLQAQTAAVVPVTGLKSTGSETYGGQSISYITLAAGQSVTLPLS